MNFYWLYDLTNVQMFFVIISIVTFVSLLKPLFFNDYFEKRWHITRDSNPFVISFLSLTGAFMSITLGLVAVGTFDTFKESEETVSKEASSLAALYNDVQMFDKTEKQQLSDKLKEFTKYIVNEAWPEQQKGIVPVGGNKILDEFRHLLKNYEPSSEREMVIYDEVLSQYNTFLEKQRLRLECVSNGLPASIYAILFLGILINIIISWQIKIDNRRIEILIGALSGILAGSLVYIIVAMDNPFRGEFTVSAAPYQFLLDTIMK